MNIDVCSCVCVCVYTQSLSHVQPFGTPWTPGKNTGVGCHVLLQGIFLTQGSNQGLPPTLQVDSLLSKPPGKPKYIKIFLNKIKLTCNKDENITSPLHLANSA